MTQTPPQMELPDVAQKGIALYEEKFKRDLEASHSGEAIALHVDTEDYALGKTHTEARRKLGERTAPDGRVVTLTIGPPTEAEIEMAQRFLRNRKA